MEKIYIFGHQNPDTDTICSSLAYAMYKQEQGFDVEAIRLGEVNAETQYVLDYLNLQQPRLLEAIDDDQKVIMIDHNEFAQSIKNIENAQILEVIDHHRVAGFTTKAPVMMNLKPLGCSATIIYQMMESDGFELNAQIATLLCSAIISDSLLFQSPTCTPTDVAVCKKLASIAQIDVEVYGMEMLKAGTDLSSYSASELLGIDSKTFESADGKINVSQVNTVCIDDVLIKKQEILEAMQQRLETMGLSQCILLITDIINANSMALVLGDENKFSQKFNVEVSENQVMLEGVLSRKKQIVPFL